MFKTILVPTDFQEKNRGALDVSVRMALWEQGRVLLLHVIETIDDAGEGEFEAFYDRLRKQAVKKMNDMAARYTDRQVRIDRHIVFGKRVREIVGFAGEHGVDVIVLASHKIDPANPVEGWATLSYRVAILAPCHVLMVK
ncbi:MAG: universal stress protein [Deltaproteobacteria bacterium]|nr:universal stress protein [Deltaproteobacteria bacterium]